MRAVLAAVIGASALAACGFGGPPKPMAEGAEKMTAMPHPDAQYLVKYGGESFRVNVRYVPLIDESVIAVRQGIGEAHDENWPSLNVGARKDFSRVMNYADDAYRDHVVEIAGAVQAKGGICADGASIAMAKNRDGDVRTLYRRNRQVWVVFALCPGEAVPPTG
ncbi:MAG: hypothetical protein AAF899_19620 [Pseudomonadota bacterium]